MDLFDDVQALHEHMLAQRDQPPALPPPLLLPAWAVDIPELAQIARDNPERIIISEPIPLERTYE